MSAMALLFRRLVILDLFLKRPTTTPTPSSRPSPSSRRNIDDRRPQHLHHLRRLPTWYHNLAAHLGLLESTEELPNLPIIRPSRQSSSSSYYDNRHRHNRSPWYRKLSTNQILAGVALTLIAFYCLSHCETIPYTNHTRLLLMSPSTERCKGNSEFEKYKYQLDILPPAHPDSIRIRLITHNIIDALERHIATPIPFDWEVVVVRDEEINAACMLGGKIIVNTGLLRYLTTDTEIASVISHEVGHATARHVAELITYEQLFFRVLRMILVRIIHLPVRSTNKFLSLQFELPFFRRTELEADYIGLLLLASAGYDPRVAVKVEEKVGKLTGEYESLTYQNYFSTHPSFKQRSQLLTQAMDVALAVYLEGIDGGDGVKNSVQDVRFSSTWESTTPLVMC